MKEEKHAIKKVVSDKLSAMIILISVIVASVGAIVVHKVIAHNEIKATSGKLSIEEVNENKIGSVDEFVSVENINSIEELQKLNEKELEEAEKKDEKEDKNKTKNSAKYYIKVNYKAQVVTVYTKDSKGNYTVPVRAMVCSTGTYTPKSGVFKIPAKIRWCHMIGDVWGQYCSQIVGDILFHSVPYTEKGNHSSLMYKKYDQLGTKASLGCIRLTCIDAKWIYDNCKVGTQVEFYSSSNPGPLGKPSARKISNAPKNIRGWDPTDPAPNNPWIEYLKENEKDNSKEDEKVNKVPEETITNTIPDEPIVNETVSDSSTTKPSVNETITNEIAGGKGDDEENDDKENDDPIDSNVISTNSISGL